MKHLIIHSLLVMTLCLLTGCQSMNTLQNNYSTATKTSLYLDDEFSGYENIVIETEAEIFALSDEMKKMAKRIGLERGVRKKARTLINHFFNPENINLTYRTGANVIAAEAFQNKEANCLSLTIMAYAIAKEAKLNVAFQSVDIPEYWVRNGNTNMLTGHINLTVLDPKAEQTVLLFERSQIEIDFDPFVLKKPFPKRRINKNTVLAMFYNNKGANALIKGDYLTAYAYLSSATKVAPDFSSAWGNLGILYRFKGYEKNAIAVYRYAINLNHSNLTAMSNLSMLLHVDGSYEKYQEAKKLDAHIMRKRANNPYYYSLLGDEKFHQGAYFAAINHYKKAIKLNNSIHEFYFGLAKVYYMLDDLDKAESYMRKAIRKNRGAYFEERYLAKLSVLQKSH